jgi:hypothetical protein
MAITVRLTEEQELALESFMSKYDHNTKNKTILWLIENGERLCKNDETLCSIVIAEKKKAETFEQLKNVKSPNLNSYFY